MTPQVGPYHKAVHHESEGLLKQPFDILLDRPSKKKKKKQTQNSSLQGLVLQDKALIWRANHVFVVGKLAALFSPKPKHA